MAQKKLSTLIEIGSSIKAFQQNNKTVIGDVKKLGQTVEKLQKLQKATSAETLKGLNKSKKAWEDAQKEVSDLAKELKNTQKPSADLNRRFERAKRVASAAKSAYEKNRHELHDLRSELKKAGYDSKNFTKANEQLGKSIEKLNKKYNASKAFGSAGASLRGASQKTSGASIGASLALGASVGSFANFEKGLTSVYTLLDKSDYKKYKKELAEVSKEAIRSGFSIEDSNKALFDTISAMGVNAKSIETYRVGQKLAKAGVTELGIAINGLSSIQNAYGKEAENSTKVANAFFTAQKMGKTTVEELAVNVGKIAPAAKAAGVSYEMLLSTMSALTLGGLSTDEATTALRGALSGLVKPSKEAEKVLKKLKVPVGMTEIRSKGLAYALQQLNKAMKEHPDLVADAIPDVMAFTAVTSLSEEKLKKVDDALRNIDKDFKSGTGMADAFSKVMKTLADNTKSTWGEVTVLSIELGESLAPILIPTLQLLKGVASFLSAMPAPLKFITVGVIALTAALSPMLALLGGISYGIGGLISLKEKWAITTKIAALANTKLGSVLITAAKGPFIAFQKIIQGLTFAQQMWNLSMTANPIGTVVAAVAALVGGLILLYNTFEPVKKIIDSIGSAVAGFFGGGQVKKIENKISQSSANSIPSKSIAKTSNVNQKVDIQVLTHPNQNPKEIAQEVQKTMQKNKPRGLMYDPA